MRSTRSKLLLRLLLPALLVTVSYAEGSPRLRFTINENWRFTRSDPANAEASDFDDAKWERINLPHTWNIADTLDDEPGYRRAPSWYRRALNVGSNLAAKRVFLYFEGANQKSELFVNGTRIGGHVGGYSAFVFDITEHVRSGEKNILAVRVDNTRDVDVPPIDGDFNMHGGIYRDVWLIAASDVHVKIDDLASSGVTIRTPKVSEREASVDVSGTLVNTSANARQLTVRSSVHDREGKEISKADKDLRVEAHSQATFDHRTIELKQPNLWSPDSPYLYTVRTAIIENGKKLDETSDPLGLRWFRFDANEGFFLNGKPLKLIGTNRHQDRKGMGNAVPDELHVRDMEIIKDTGFNFVRLAHYPQDPSVLEAADRLGLLLWEEIPIVNQIHVSPAFKENAARMLREMIRQHRNHPSVLIWGFMNEVFLPVPKTAEHVQATVELARMLEKVCKEEDPDRPTAIAFDHGARELYNSFGLGDVTQIVGWNLYHGWYYETFDDFGKFMDEQHRSFPRRIFMVSEYGANADQRVHSLKPKRFDSTVEWQRMYHESYLPQITARKYISGSAVWNNFDFSSEFRGETIPHINQKGLFTYDRRPKDISYFYKASLAPTPVLHVAVRAWSVRSGKSEQPVDIYTNLDEAELFLNGKSLGRKRSGSSRKITWDVKFRTAQNSLFVRGGLENSITDAAEIRWIDPAGMSDVSVNAGSNAEYVHDTGSLWQADRAYSPGGWGFVGSDSKETANLRNILGTDEDAVAQTAREGSFAYRFDVAAGEYEIELWFAELKDVKPGERVFDVSINDVKVVKALDLAKEARPFTLLVRKFRIPVRDRNEIMVKLEQIAGQPIISGLRIRKID